MAPFDEGLINQEDTREQWQPIKWRLLVQCSLICMLGPLTGTLITPALGPIVEEFNASTLQVGLLVGLGSLVVGIVAFAWGPISDRLSRKWAIAVGLGGYFVLCYTFAWSPTMNLLIVSRTVMNIFIPCYYIVTTGVISDSFYPQERGTAIGLRGLLPLSATMFGPPLGGMLAYFNWRLIGVFCAALGAALFLVSLFCLPETLDKQKARATSISPFKPLALMIVPRIFFPALMQSFCIGSAVLSSLVVGVEFPEQHDMNSLQVGLCLIPLGLGTATGAVFGGRLADRFSVKFGRGGRLLISCCSPYILATFLFIFGWTLSLHYLIPTFVGLGVGFFSSMVNPGVITFAIEERPLNASAVNSAVGSVLYITMFAAQVGGLPLGDATGYGILFMICGGMVLASTLPNIFLAYQKWNVRSQARKLVEPTSVETFDHGNRRQEQ